MTDLESPKKNNDCYFYYYSTCAKGDSCTFRHEPSALGCETMCSFWKEGKCLNVHCNFRHMELRKNRKVIPCYWESQPGGCLKPHCPFLHTNPKSIEQEEALGKGDLPTTKSGADSMLNEKMSNSNDSFKNTPVDSLVVNFEEESDSESAPANSPIKSSHRIVKVKTLEEIKLEKIQEESAAYYSYHDVQEKPVNTSEADDLRQRILQRMNKNVQQSNINIEEESLDKIIEAKKRFANFDDTTSTTDSVTSRFKRQKISAKTEKKVGDIKIKTLTEIRAERKKRFADSAEKFQEIQPSSQVIRKGDEAEVSSTSTEENFEDEQASERKQLNKIDEESNPKRRIKLRRKLSATEENVVSSLSPKLDTVETMKTSDDSLKKKIKLRRKSATDDAVVSTMKSDIGEEEEITGESVERNENSEETSKELVQSIPCDNSYNHSDSNKTMDEVLLLEDDEDISNVSLQAEDDLLNEIDDLLNE